MITNEDLENNQDNTYDSMLNKGDDENPDVMAWDSDGDL